MQERAKQAKKRPAPAKSSSKLVDLSKSGEEEGVLDNLLECLQSGSALQPARYCLYRMNLSACIFRPLPEISNLV